MTDALRAALKEASHEVVDLARIRRFEGQPRVFFDTKKLAALAASIRNVGQLTEGLLRRVPPKERGADGCDLELIDGERRWLACRAAGVATYRAAIVDLPREALRYQVSVIANFHREQHTVQEMVSAIVRLHEQDGVALREIATLLGRHEVTVTGMYGLRRLVPDVWKMLQPDARAGEKISLSAAISISKLPPGRQLEIAQMAAAGMPLDALKARLATDMAAEAVGDGGGGTRSRGRSRRDSFAGDPFMVRRGLDRRGAALSRKAQEMADVLEATPKPVLTGWVGEERIARLADLRRAIETLERCERMLKRAFG